MTFLLLHFPPCLTDVGNDLILLFIPRTSPVLRYIRSEYLLISGLLCAGHCASGTTSNFVMSVTLSI